MSANTWRSPGERADLVERLVAAEKGRRIAEMKARAALAEHPRDEVTHLAVRIVELEDSLERANRKIAELNGRLMQRRSA